MNNLIQFWEKEIKTEMNKRFFRLGAVFVLCLAMLFVSVSCGKKEETKNETPAPATVAKVETKSEAKAEEPKAEVVVEAPVEEIVIDVPELVGTVEEEEVAEPVEVVEETVVETPSISVPDRYPVLLSDSIGGEEFSLEAYDGYAFVYFPEHYTESDVDSFLDTLVSENSYISDEVGWTVDKPGVAIVAYPFGLAPVEIANYAVAIAQRAI